MANNNTSTSVNPKPADSADEYEFDLRAIFNVIWRGKFWIFLAATLGFIVGGFYAFRVAVPIYPASSIILLNNQRENVVDIQGVVSDNLLTGGWGDRSRMSTEIIAMTSRNMMSKLVDHLNLMEDPEYNRTLIKVSDEAAAGGFSLRGFVYNLFARKGDVVAKERSEEEISAAVRANIIERLIRTLRVQTINDTHTFEISAVTTSPVESVRLANGLANVYIQDSVDQKFTTTERASQWLSQKAAELKIELEESEQRIKKFSDGTNLISEESLSLLTTQLKDLRQRISLMKSDLAAEQFQYENLQAAIATGDVQQIAENANDGQLAQLASGVLNGNTERSVFDARAQALASQSKTVFERTNQQLQALATSESSLRQKIEEQSDDLVALQQLERETEASSLLYESFLSRLKEISIQQGMLSPSSRMLSPAIPQDKSAPRRPRIMMLCLILGGIIASGILLFREFMNSTFRTPEDLETFSTHRLLGTVPRLKEKTRKGVLGYVTKHPTSAFAESIRNLRTSILLSDIDNPPQVIMSTSSQPAEGKTTISLTLAQNMAGLGKRVLVLEGDIRKRVFAEYFDISDKTGFIAVMTGDAKLEDSVYRPDGLGVDILIGEKSSANAADIFSSQKFADLIKQLRESYDYIVIDTPPVLAVPDARIVAQHVDAIVYSVRWDKTLKAELKNGLAMFDNVGVTIDGLVMTQLDTKRMKSYGYTGKYGYHYGQGTSGYTEG